MRGMLVAVFVYIRIKVRQWMALSESVFTPRFSAVALIMLTLVSCSESENPSQDQDMETKGDALVSEQKPDSIPEDMVWVPGGKFLMGATKEEGLDGESPQHTVQVSGFLMDKHEVTNAQFSAFVQATGHVTEAERIPDWEVLKEQLPLGTPRPPDSMFKAGSIVFFANDRVQSLEDYTQWWEWLPGADWRHPVGPKSSIDSLMDHPVVHVNWFDAMAYAKWAGRDLPTEAEWELAARADRPDVVYPWGNATPNDQNPQANYFQGEFPKEHKSTDQAIRTSKVMSFTANPYGLYDLGGNVWEWSKDWYHPSYFQQCLDNGISVDPQGAEKSFDPHEPAIPKRVTKGGSFLCNDVYCSGYKVTRRMRTDPYSSLDHTGFRCVIRP